MDPNRPNESPTSLPECSSLSPHAVPFEPRAYQDPTVTQSQAEFIRDLDHPVNLLPVARVEPFTQIQRQSANTLPEGNVFVTPHQQPITEWSFESAYLHSGAQWGNTSVSMDHSYSDVTSQYGLPHVYQQPNIQIPEAGIQTMQYPIEMRTTQASIVVEYPGNQMLLQAPGSNQMNLVQFEQSQDQNIFHPMGLYSPPMRQRDEVFVQVVHEFDPANTRDPFYQHVRVQPALRLNNQFTEPALNESIQNIHTFDSQRVMHVPRTPISYNQALCDSFSRLNMSTNPTLDSNPARTVFNTALHEARQDSGIYRSGNVPTNVQNQFVNPGSSNLITANSNAIPDLSAMPYNPSNRGNVASVNSSNAIDFENPMLAALAAQLEATCPGSSAILTAQDESEIRLCGYHFNNVFLRLPNKFLYDVFTCWVCIENAKYGIFIPGTRETSPHEQEMEQSNLRMLMEIARDIFGAKRFPALAEPSGALPALGLSGEGVRVALGASMENENATLAPFEEEENDTPGPSGEQENGNRPSQEAFRWKNKKRRNSELKENEKPNHEDSKKRTFKQKEKAEHTYRPGAGYGWWDLPPCFYGNEEAEGSSSGSQNRGRQPKNKKQSDKKG